MAKEIEAREGAVRFSPDEWMLRLGCSLYDEDARGRVEGLQWEVAQRLVLLGVSVVLENGFWSKAERDRYRETGHRLGARVRVCSLEVDADELKRRVAERNRGLTDDLAFVNPEDVDAWSQVFEAPTEEETGG